MTEEESLLQIIKANRNDCELGKCNKCFFHYRGRCNINIATNKFINKHYKEWTLKLLHEIRHKKAIQLYIDKKYDITKLVEILL